MSSVPPSVPASGAYFVLSTTTFSGVGVGASVGVPVEGVVVVAGLGLAAEPQAANTIAETATNAMIGLRINAPPMWRSRIAERPALLAGTG